MQIVGIMLVHNEDIFLRRAVQNVVKFCDRILIAEHHSSDRTPEIAQELADEYANVTVHTINDPQESQRLLQPYANTPTWVLGVDGDELYDPAGLTQTRRVLESGAWDNWWTVFGNAVNCVSLDEERRLARGYLAPPCRSMTKLYNFAAVQELDLAAPQRLMGQQDRFHEGYHAGLRLDVFKTTEWDEAHFRCLHTCFLPRSSSAPTQAGGRANLTDLSKRPLVQRLFPSLFRGAAGSAHKQEKYRRGPLVTVDASPFLPEPVHA